jgi:hypothetical protein
MAANPGIINLGTDRVSRRPNQVIEALSPLEAAKLARLHHSLDDRPGITRHQARSGFDYRRPDGSLVGDVRTLRAHSVDRDPAGLDRCMD